MKRFTLALCLCASVLANAAVAADNAVKVFLLGGQSNMDGCGRWEEMPERLQKPPANVLMWDNKLTKWVALGQDSFAKRRNNMFGPEVGFAHRLSKAYPDHTIALVKTSAGGTKLHTQWLPGKGMYQRFAANNANAIENLKRAGKKYEVAGMLWMQGESDSETVEMATAYEKNLKTLIDDVRKTYKNEKLPFVMGRISSSLLKKTPWNFDQAPTVQKAQDAVAAADDHVRIVNTDKLSTWKDNTHFGTESQLTLGDQMATLMLEELGQGNAKNDVSLNVDWKSILADHDMVWRKLPSNKTEAPHLVLYAGDEVPWLTIEPLEVDETECHYFGLQ